MNFGFFAETVEQLDETRKLLILENSLRSSDFEGLQAAHERM